MDVCVSADGAVGHLQGNGAVQDISFHQLLITCLSQDTVAHGACAFPAVPVENEADSFNLPVPVTVSQGSLGQLLLQSDVLVNNSSYPRKASVRSPAEQEGLEQPS